MSSSWPKYLRNKALFSLNSELDIFYSHRCKWIISITYSSVNANFSQLSLNPCYLVISYIHHYKCFLQSFQGAWWCSG